MWSGWRSSSVGKRGDDERVHTAEPPSGFGSGTRDVDVCGRVVKAGASGLERRVGFLLLAPLAPGLAVVGFESTGEADVITENAALNHGAEVVAEGKSLGLISGKADGDVDVVGFVLGDEFGRAEVVEEADADAGDVAVAGDGDDGDAHVHGFDRGGCAVVGPGVEGDVDSGIGVEVFGFALGFSEEGDAIAGDAE